ncbi:M4 family metallopeptidase [Rhodoblastus sp.]|uniref:M4 family metallopeptidase n=1 Tax=Rhodoblastus sp. TaxID=1962975 RepID=UPI0025D641C8|nr:M4 family metallopeptidase [Rhodoblastus sp.]
MRSFKNINVAGRGSDIEPNQVRLRNMMRFDQAVTVPGLEAVHRRLDGLSDESASRLFLQTYLEDSGDDSLQEITAPLRPELVPDLLLSSVSDQPALNSHSLAFQQSARNIPVFGARVVVDIDADHRTLVSINGKVAPVPDAPPIATLSPAVAWDRLVHWSNAKNVLPDAFVPPVLTWFLDEEKDVWHLAYHFAAAPFPPPDEGHDDETSAHACIRPSFRASRPEFDFFVDAKSGEVVFWFSSTPGLDVPTPMSGIDCFNCAQQFYGLAGQAGYSLVDPIRNIETYDYNFQDMDLNPPFPKGPISNATVDLAASSPQAVSAHYHATLVFDFYNNELKRNGIDGKGMKLVSVVNVYSSGNNPLPAPQWGNAVFWQNRMWYGQESGQSFAKYLDVIAHELTHGVTGSSAGLVYRNLPGALNESFSDIFGIVIANWFPQRPNAISGWTWEIGSGLAAGGGPIRNFADPAAAGQPDHMNQYKKITQDNGGVHIYSGIHNKAVYKLLTAVDANGNLSFPTREAVLLLYVALTRLTPMSDFSDSRRTLENVATVYYGYDPVVRAARLATIGSAFDSVGIH